MITSFEYDIEFCIVCKFTNVGSQSPFYRVKVVSSCSSINCSLAEGAGQFIDPDEFYKSRYNSYGGFA